MNGVEVVVFQSLALGYEVFAQPVRIKMFGSLLSNEDLEQVGLSSNGDNPGNSRSVWSVWFVCSVCFSGLSGLSGLSLCPSVCFPVLCFARPFVWVT